MRCALCFCINPLQQRFTMKGFAQEQLMNPHVRLIASLFALTALGGCYVTAGPPVAYEGEYVETEEAPPAPAPIVETIPPAPSNEDVWIEGQYRWHAHAYVWERGHYQHRPHGGARWIGGHWEKRGHRRMWVDGHWG